MTITSVFPRFALITLLAATPLAAEDTDEGRSMIEDGILLFLEGLQKQMEPTMEDLQNWADEAGPALRSFTEEMGPALADLLQQVEDWSAYHLPEIVPNGDIIIRRKQAEEAPQGTEEDATDI